MFALAMGIITANAQENVTVETTNGSEQPTLTKEVYPQKEADGDLYHGLSRKLTFDRMIPPHGLEVTYDKTVHVIFPAEVRYVDLGSPDLIAGKADGAENIIRVKATVRNFPNETNMSVITEDGSFYSLHTASAMLAFDVHNSRDLKYNKREDTYNFAGTKDENGLWNDDVFDADGNYRYALTYTGHKDLAFDQGASDSRSTLLSITSSFRKRPGQI